jgi:hypothetical protein
MLSYITPPLADVVRSMQYMSAANGGLIVDFRPIQSYAEVARGAPPHERVCTVLDRIAFATDVGLLAAGTWRGAFARPEDLGTFVDELRECDLPMNPRHAAAFTRLGVIGFDRAHDYPALADALRGRPRREAA